MGQTTEVIRAEELRASYFFHGLSNAQLDAILTVTREVNYPGGETVVRQFERSSDLLVVLSGTVKIKGISGEDIAELGEGHVVGEVSLVDNAPRSATVMSAGSVRAAVIPAEELHALMKKDVAMKAAIMETLAKLLCSRLRRMHI